MIKIGQLYIEETTNLGMFIYEVIGFRGNDVIIQYIYSQLSKPGNPMGVSKSNIRGAVLCTRVDDRHRIVRKIFKGRLDWKE